VRRSAATGGTAVAAPRPAPGAGARAARRAHVRIDRDADGGRPHPAARGLIGPVVTHLDHIPLRAGEPIVVAAPPHHGYGLTYLAAGLALGCPVIFAADLPPARRWPPPAEHRAVALFAVPVQLHRLAAQPAWPDLPHLRAVVSGAAPLPTDLYERLRDRVGERVFNLYGTPRPAGPRSRPRPTCGPRRAPWAGRRAGCGCGWSTRRGRPLPAGETGEVQVAGWRRRTGTPVGSGPGRRWLPTGDLGRLDLVGRLFLAGRVDDMIVSGGENVYPGPLLAALPRTRTSPTPWWRRCRTRSSGSASPPGWSRAGRHGDR
jgi:acyl-CoA synthetase (AMP-forming)/AMP-acid ligase II